MAHFSNIAHNICKFDRFSDYKEMVKGVELTPRKKSIIVALDKEGISSRNISIRLGFHQSTIVRFLQKYRRNGSMDRIKGRGRKRLSSAGQDRILVRSSIRNRKATSVELKRDWEERAGVKASSRTVCRRLVEKGLLARRPRKKPLPDGADHVVVGRQRLVQ